MPTLLEQFNAMKIEIAKAMAKNDQAALNRKIHVIDHEKERERKRTNPAGSTRVVLNLRSPEAWTKFQVEKERFFQIAVDPHIAIDLLIRALAETPDEQIRAWLNEGSEPPAELPAWAKD